MKIPVPIKVYAAFECINQSQDNTIVLFTQHRVAVGFYSTSPFENQYYLSFELDRVNWFANRTLKLGTFCNANFSTNKPLQLTRQDDVHFQDAKVCWLCEELSP